MAGPFIRGYTSNTFSIVARLPADADVWHWHRHQEVYKPLIAYFHKRAANPTIPSAEEQLRAQR